ncbi:MAG TPA: amidase [Streptosporangiaceae bacterium]|nr:amidase [Streptosporangiaceae bacterium]
MPEPLAVSETIGGSGIDADGVTIAALREALAAGSLSARELTAFYLGRIERLNPALRAVISVSADALSEAEASDAARAQEASRAGASDAARAGGASGPSGTAPGPLAGIPVLIKDNIAARGMPATAGSPALAGAGQGDAWLVARLREAGAVILGKANLSEWANFRSSHSTSGWSTLGGQAANPHALDRNPSGSSSGSGAAVAASLAPVAVGTETDGSIVCPASACGIVGLKPTLGLVSRAGVVPVSLAQDTAGPMTRRVADAAALLSAMAGADPADPATAAAAGQPRDYTAFLDPGALAGARIGVWRDGCAAAGPATVAVLASALARLGGLGAHLVDPVELPGADAISEPEFTALLAEFKHDLNAYLAAIPGDHPASLAGLIAYNSAREASVLAHFGQEVFEQAEATDGDLAEPGYVAARAEASRRARESLDGPLAAHRLDAIVTLTANPAWLTDYHLGDHDVFHTSGPAAVAGYPTICVPAGGAFGLPVGLSFIGPAWSEPRLIALAYAFEQAAAARLTPTLQRTCPPPAAAGRAGTQR